MLRIAFKLLLALCLLLQGSFVAFAADAVHAHERSSQHDMSGKMPCCPHRAMSAGDTMCGACGLAFMAVDLHVMPRTAPMHVICDDFAPYILGLAFRPLIRPPIV